MTKPLIRSLFLTASLLVVTCQTFAGSMPISPTILKAPWPLTIYAGVLSCEGSAVTFMANNKTYAVNGFAATRGKTLGWLDIRPIWKDNAEIPGTKVSLGPLVTRGLLLCAAK